MDLAICLATDLESACELHVLRKMAYLLDHPTDCMIHLGIQGRSLAE
jgi:hypothetical protein